MRPRAWPLLALTLAAGGGSGPESSRAPCQEPELELRVRAGVEEVELGVGFPLTVVRRWSVELVPEDFREEALAPLVVRLLDTSRREEDQRIEETLHYRAYAFSLREIVIPAPLFRARRRNDGSEVVASGEELRLRVRSALGAEPGPGQAELPGGPFPAPLPWLRWLVIAVGVLAGLGLVMGFSRWRAMRPRSQTEPELAPHERALQRLAHLREHQPRGFEETRAYYVEASNLLRQYIEERDSLCGSGMTTEEFLTDPQTVSSFRVPHRQMLSAFLTHCDLVKFARHPTTEAEREQVLSAAETFVQETRGEGIAEGGAA